MRRFVKTSGDAEDATSRLVEPCALSRHGIHAFSVPFLRRFFQLLAHFHDVIRALHIPQVFGMISGATRPTPDTN